jgi:hypothetical protein
VDVSQCNICRYLVLSLCFLIACNNGVKQSSEAKVVKRLIGKKLNFTDNLLTGTSEKEILLGFELFHKKSLKIVSMIKLDCGVCIESINGWKEYLKDQDVTFMLIISGSDFEFFKAIKLNEEQNLKNIFYDNNNIFELTNKIPVETRFRTFLIDEDNTILLIGNPLSNKNIDNLYKKEIRNLTIKQ